jgi:hypothetical protein
MVKIINLRLARKQKKRSDKEIISERNRAKFGRAKAEKLKELAIKKLDEKHLDAHKLEE